MIHTSRLSKGLYRIRVQFLQKLSERRESLLNSALQASEAEDPQVIALHLNAVKDILHQIAGTAGTLGFIDFGLTARRIETTIIALLGSPDEIFVSPELIDDLVAFAQTADDIMRRG